MDGVRKKSIAGIGEKDEEASENDETGYLDQCPYLTLYVSGRVLCKGNDGAAVDHRYSQFAWSWWRMFTGSSRRISRRMHSGQRARHIRSHCRQLGWTLAMLRLQVLFTVGANLPIKYRRENLGSSCSSDSCRSGPVRGLHEHVPPAKLSHAIEASRQGCSGAALSSTHVVPIHMRLLPNWRTPATLIRPAVQRRWIADARPFAAGDLVLLRQKADRSATLLTRPLRPGNRIDTHKGIISHDEIIGKRVRDVVTSRTTKSEIPGTDYRLHQVSLDEYARLSRRLVTPIYPYDANLIVSLLDLHPDTVASVVEDEEDGPKLEILEAGTGHGSLTLHLSRALHAGNPSMRGDSIEYDSDEWKSQRRAIIHTTDISPKYAKHAEGVVRGFRDGLYARNVDFHVGDVSDVVGRLRESRGTAPFLSHAFLDLPSADAHLATVTEALRVDGTLIVFNPSITQITDCATKIKDENVQLVLDSVIELGVNGASGGREWDVRFVRPRATQKARREAATTEAATTEASTTEATTTEAAIGEASTSETTTTEATTTDDKWSMVCRPKVGDRIFGGGFLGVWRKHRDTSSPSQGAACKKE